MEDEGRPCDKNITMKELQTAINRLKSRKASGLDGVPGEAIKNLPPLLLQHLLTIINMLWNASHTPTDWSIAVTTLKHKKTTR